MMRIRGAGTALGLAALLVCGCAGEGDAPAPAPANGGPAAKAPAAAKPSTATPAARPSEGPKMEGPAGANTGPSDEVLANLKKLPAADQPLATAQKVCPVSGEPLGEMGAPIKVTAEGRTFFLCCKSCEADVKADPKAVIAKLDKK